MRIGEREFVWTALIDHTSGVDQRCVHLRVWGSMKNGRMLEVVLLSKSPAGPWGACTDTVFPTPRDVRAVIDHALLLGWEPATTGGRYILPDDALVPPLELPAFTISPSTLT